jgi:OOP family OmpA-OmpF porin
MRLIGAISLALAAGIVALPLAAQTLSDEELLQRFESQRSAFRSAEESETGRTRGLTLVTVDDAQAPSAAMAADQPVPGEGATVTGSADEPSAVTGIQRPPQLGLQPLVPEATPVVFGKLDPELQVNVRIQFAFDSAALSADQKPKLEQLCRVMKASDIKKFRVVGHTDASGSDAYNERLSILRAQEVQRYFVNDCGIDPARLEAVGMGERFLFNAQDPRGGENRRVEFQAMS